MAINFAKMGMSEKMKKLSLKNDNRDQGSIHLVIIMIAVVALLGTLGFIIWTNFVRSGSSDPLNSSHSAYSKPDGWSSYSTQDFPFTFDYPNTWLIEKSIEHINQSETSFGGGVHTTIMLNAYIKSSKKQTLRVAYSVGTFGSSSDDAPVCNSQKLIQIANAVTPAGNIFICNDTKEWEYSEPEKESDIRRTKLSVFSGKEMEVNTDTLKKVVESFRRS